jgi:hypothetical protein
MTPLINDYVNNQESLKATHVQLLAAALQPEAFNWRRWSPRLEEVVVVFVGLQGWTEAVIVAKNAARKMVVETDDLAQTDRQTQTDADAFGADRRNLAGE